MVVKKLISKLSKNSTSPFPFKMFFQPDRFAGDDTDRFKQAVTKEDAAVAGGQFGLQGRDQGIEIKLMRSSFWPCTWNVQEAYGAPADADDLAELPGQGEPLPCEAFPGR